MQPIVAPISIVQVDGLLPPNSREAKAATAATAIASRPAHANIGKDDKDNSVSGGHKATTVLAKPVYARSVSKGFTLSNQLFEGTTNDRNDP